MCDEWLMRGMFALTRGLRAIAGLTAVAVVTSILIAAPAPTPASALTTGAAQVDASRCADVLFVGVRGSGEGPTDHDGYGQKVSLVLAGFVAGLDSSLTYRSITLDYPSLPIAPSDGFDGSLVGDWRATASASPHRRLVSTPTASSRAPLLSSTRTSSRTATA